MSSPESSARCVRIDSGDTGKRLDRFLAQRLGASRAEVRRLLAGGGVSLDGRPLGEADKGRPLPGAGSLRVESYRPPAERRILAEAAPLCILAEGPGWLAIDKPAGMPVHPLREDESGTVLGAVAARHPELHGVGEGGLRSGVVHRLDVDTSGVLLVAIGTGAWHSFRSRFRERRIEKQYMALVAGELAARRDVEVDLLVARHRPAKVRVIPPTARHGAPPARHTERHTVPGTQSVRHTVPGTHRVGLSVWPVESMAGATLVGVAPDGGFLHQIRATLAHLGHPVLGDATYGSAATAALAARHLLHASRLAWDDVVVESPLPSDFAAVVERLRTAGSGA